MEIVMKIAHFMADLHKQMLEETHMFHEMFSALFLSETFAFISSLILLSLHLIIFECMLGSYYCEGPHFQTQILGACSSVLVPLSAKAAHFLSSNLYL